MVEALEEAEPTKGVADENIDYSFTTEELLGGPLLTIADDLLLEGRQVGRQIIEIDSAPAGEVGVEPVRDGQKRILFQRFIECEHLLLHAAPLEDRDQERDEILDADQLDLPKPNIGRPRGGDHRSVTD